jgi:hypothetical protein
MLHRVHLAQSKAPGWMGGAAHFSVSQNGDRAEVLYAIEDYFGCGRIRPDRSDRTLKWETRRLEDLLGRVIPIPAVAADVGEEARLRAVRSRLPTHGRGLASESSRPHGDLRARTGHESERETAISRISDTRTAAG